MEADVSDLTALTLAEARDGLKARRFSSRELTEAHLQAMDRARGLNAYIVETPEQALAMAEQATPSLAAGGAGPLEGLPIGVKDLYATKGVHTQACSHILTASSRPINRPSPPICGATAR